jgi:hypothetical protein
VGRLKSQREENSGVQLGGGMPSSAPVPSGLDLYFVYFSSHLFMELFRTQFRCSPFSLEITGIHHS